MIFKPPLPRLRRGHPLTNGLVFAAPFYEGSGGIIHDISGRNSNGTMANMDPNTDWVGGPHGWILDFDGADDRVGVPHASWQLLTTGGTIVSLFNARSIGETQGRIADKSDATTVTNGFSYRLIANALRFSINAGTQIDSAASSISYGTWYLTAVTWDASGLVTHYINGKVNGTPGSTASPTGITSTVELAIGNRAAATDRTFDGKIGPVLIFNRALSASEITWLYFNPAIIYEPPKKYWLFGAASPQTLTPDPADYDWTAVDPTLTPGSVTLAPDPADYDWTVNDATLTPGAVTLTPDPAVFTWTVNNPTITAGSVTLTPDPAEFEWIANDAGISASTDITLYPEPAVWQWYAQSPSIEAQECEPLLGCRQSLFTYSIQAGIQPAPGDDCEVVSGCRLSYFTYEIE